MGNRNSPRTLKTVDNAITILNALHEHGGLTVTAVADILDKDPGTVYHYLNTLHENEYVVKEQNQYYPSLAFIEVANYVKDRKKEYRIADTYTDQVYAETNCRSVFLVEEHGRGVYLSIQFGEYPNWKHAHIGHRCPLHNRAGGKAILAFLDETHVRKIVDTHGLEQSTPHTITDVDTLLAELDQIRETGVSFNMEEQIIGINAVGVPIISNGSVIGSLTAGGAADRLRGEWFREILPQTLKGIANEFELDLSLTE